MDKFKVISFPYLLQNVVVLMQAEVKLYFKKT